MTTKTPEGIKRALVLGTGNMPESEPDFGGCTAMEYEFGYVVFVLDAGSCDDGMVPDWLIPVMKYAYENDCMLINFDRDEDSMDMFTEYDW